MEENRLAAYTFFFLVDPLSTRGEGGVISSFFEKVELAWGLKKYSLLVRALLNDTFPIQLSPGSFMGSGSSSRFQKLFHLAEMNILSFF